MLIWTIKVFSKYFCFKNEEAQDLEGPAGEARGNHSLQIRRSVLPDGSTTGGRFTILAKLACGHKLLTTAENEDRKELNHRRKGLIAVMIRPF